MKKEFLVLLVQIYQDAIKVTMNITVAPCLHFLNHGEEVMTWKNHFKLAGMTPLISMNLETMKYN